MNLKKMIMMDSLKKVEKNDFLVETKKKLKIFYLIIFKN